MPRNGAVVLCLLCLCSTVALADPTPHSRWSWTPLGTGIGERGFSALDVNGDGRAELFAAPQSQSYWYELRRDGLFRQFWTSFLDESSLVALDSIGTPSGGRIATLYQPSLRIFDAASKAELLHIVTATTSNADVALGDLDRDGVLDAVVCDANTLYRFELATGAQTGVRYGFGCTDVDIGQIDTDPQLEIAIAGNQTGGYVLDGVTLAVEWGDLEGFGQQLALGDLDGDGRDEILASDDYDNDARALDPETSSELWRLSGGYNPSQLLVADLDPSPGAEAIVYKPYYSDISVLKGATGELIRAHPAQSSYVSPFAAADTDGDGDLELVWSASECCYSSIIWVLEGGSNVVSRAAQNTSSLTGGFATGDFGDPLVKEIAIATPTDDYQLPDQIVLLEMAHGREVRRSAFDADSSLGSVSALTGMQLDGDAALEICTGSSSGNGPLACVDGLTFEEEWSGGAYGYIQSMQVAELDGDPAPELLAATSGPAIEAREGESGWLKWRTPELATSYDRMTQLLVLDLEGDGFDEVVGRMTSNYYEGGDLALFSGASGDLLSGPWNLQASAMAKPALADNPPLRVYVALDDATIRGLDPETGDTTPALVALPDIARALAVVDLDLDGELDYVIVDYEMHLQVVSGATGTIAWAGPFLGPSEYGGGGLWLEAGDLDGNGVPDFAAASSYGVFFFEGPLSALLVDGFETGDTLAWSVTVP